MFVENDFKIVQKDNKIIIKEGNNDGSLEYLELILGDIKYCYLHDGDNSKIIMSPKEYSRIKTKLKMGFGYEKI